MHHDRVQHWPGSPAGPPPGWSAPRRPDTGAQPAALRAARVVRLLTRAGLGLLAGLAVWWLLVGTTPTTAPGPPIAALLVPVGLLVAARLVLPGAAWVEVDAAGERVLHVRGKRLPLDRVDRVGLHETRLGAMWWLRAPGHPTVAVPRGNSAVDAAVGEALRRAAAAPPAAPGTPGDPAPTPGASRLRTPSRAHRVLEFAVALAGALLIALVGSTSGGSGAP